MKINTALLYGPKYVADILFHRSERKALFEKVNPAQRPAVFRSLTKNIQREVLQLLDDKDVTTLIELLDPDEATDALQLLTKKKRQRILQGLSTTLKDALSTLLEFDAQTAAGLMTLDYVRLGHNQSVKDALEKFKKHERSTGRPPVLLVTKNDQLKGFIPTYQLILSAKDDLLDHLVKTVPTISYTASHDDVVDTFQKHPHTRVVVLNDANNIVGVIYSDDVLRLLSEQEAASLYDFAGINKEESVSDSARAKIQHRYKWLILNLLTAFIAAYTVNLFEDTLTAYVLLAVYMPIVAGMGGNAATQTLAVMVRGISRQQLTIRAGLKTLKKELLAGLGNGVINGLLVGVIVYGINREILLSVVLGLAMLTNLMVAAFFGTVIPLILARLGKDPAASATVFITTATDVLGFVVFLGLGALLLV